MAKVVVTTKSEAEVKYLRATCGVRYWEDATVNGKEDTDGTLIPLRDGDTWKVTIDLATGIIEGWPEGTTAKIHYKVCDEGRIVALASGATIVDAIAALEKEIEHIETLKQIRALPPLALYGAGADNKKPPHQPGG